MAKLLDNINNRIRSKEIDHFYRETIRLLKSSIEIEQKKAGKNLTDEQEMTVLKKEIKEMNKIAEEYKDKEEYSSRFKKRAEMLSDFLPVYLSKEDTGKIVDNVLLISGISTKKQFKQAIELVMSESESIDSTILSKILQAKLK